MAKVLKIKEGKRRVENVSRLIYTAAKRCHCGIVYDHLLPSESLVLMYPRGKPIWENRALLGFHMEGKRLAAASPTPLRLFIILKAFR